jgi:uroporphyrinogen decarboxylase
MRPKDLLLSAFSLSASARVPALIFGGGFWAARRAGKSFRELLRSGDDYAEAVLGMQRAVESDMVFVGSGLNNLLCAALGCEVRMEQTSLQVLTHIEPEKELVGKVNELKEIATLRQGFEVVNEEIGDRYLVAVTSWGPFTLAANLVGVEKLMTDLYMNPRAAKQALELATLAIEEFYSPFLDLGLEAVSLAEPSASGNLISREHFLTFALPYLSHLVEHFKKRGVVIYLHHCGSTEDRVRDIAAIKPSCLSLGQEVNLPLVKREIASVACVAGNIDPMLLLKASPAQVAREAKALLNAIGDTSGFVLSPGCDVPPTAPVENLRALLSATQAQR